MTGIKVRASAKPAIYPVTTWQQYILDEATHPECTDDLRNRFILANAILVRPKVDLRRLRRAVDKLRQRHDSLRIQLHQIKNKWRALIDPPGEDTVQEVDLGDMDDDAFHAKISALANAAMPLIASPLAEVIVAHCGGRGDVLITRVHHAITDGYGMVILTEDLTKLLIGIPITGDAVSHADYLKRFQNPLPSKAAKVAAYWEALHRDAPPAPNVGRKAKNLEPLNNSFGEVEQRELTYRVSGSSLRNFEARAAEESLAATTLLFAAYLEAVCQCYDLEKLFFLVAISRSNPALDTYVGDHTLDAFLPYTRSGNKGLTGAAQVLRDTISEAMENLPSDAARRGTPYQRALAERGCTLSQFSVHQPRPMARQDKSIFSEGFYVGSGSEQQMGPFTLTTLDVSVPRRRYSDLRLEVGSAKVRTGFGISYCGISYTEGEVRKLADKICQLLKFEITGAELK